MGNILFLGSATCFSLLLIIVFFYKQTVNSAENKIFKIISITNLIGLIVELILQICVLTSSVESVQSSFIITVISKIYLIYIIVWFTIMSMYTVIISFKDKLTKKNLIGTIIMHVVTCVCLSILSAILDISKYYDGTIMYTYGPAVDVIKVIGILYIIFWLICIFINLKNIRQKKFYPIIAVVLALLITSIIQIYRPELLLITVIGTFVCYLMFFTIENPDIKLINELNIAIEQAKRANNAKTDFLSNMSHEIRTPLNAIVGFSECVKDADSLEEAKENANDIVKASDTLLEIVNSILDISKIEAGKLEIIDVDYDPRELFNNICALIRPRMVEKKLEFNINIAPDLPGHLYGDYISIKKIVTNLLTNACKYTNEGYVTFNVNSVIIDDICRLFISVEDSGIGIKKENIDKLFTKFERLEIEKNTTTDGTGLGLAITKKLVELMGGSIVAQSKYGEGSVFSVTFNQKIKNDVLIKQKEEQFSIDCSNKKVLVVDDNVVNSKVAYKLLKNYNAVIDVCNSGFECIERIKTERYDLILLDDMMPKMSGVETLRKLKENPNFDIPVVAVTANAIAGEKEKYLTSGFNDYLAKPIDRKELHRVIATYLKNN